MEILDAQLHANDQHPVAEHIEHMAAEGVAGALLVQTIPQGFDNRFLLKAAVRHPGRFGVVGVLDPAAADVEGDVARWAATPDAVGLRLVILGEERVARLRGGHYEPLLAAAETSGVPMFVYAPRLLGEVEAIALGHPALTIVLDHLGLPQPPVLEVGENPWADLPAVLALARLPNVAVKCSGLPTTSTQPYPFSDLWPMMHSVLDAFGPRRAMWGSDITREGAGHTYAEAVGWVRDTHELTSEEKRLVLGDALRALCCSSAVGRDREYEESAYAG